MLKTPRLPLWGLQAQMLLLLQRAKPAPIPPRRLARLLPHQPLVVAALRLPLSQIVRLRAENSVLGEITQNFF